MPDDARTRQLTDWLRDVSPDEFDLICPASDDASFRRYFRLKRGDESWIVMDAPPPQEDCRPFVTVADFLARMALNAPRVVASDLEHGFLLLSDLGSHQYLDELTSNPDNAETLYCDAIDALVTMQREGAGFLPELKPYDIALLSRELSLFHDWLCGTHLRIEFNETEEQSWLDLTRVLIDNSLQQSRVFVHRDYHSRNLMVTAKDNPGILDFQDAVSGPLTYDLVSLLKDCYVTWPAEVTGVRARYFYEKMGGCGLEWAQFKRQFDLTGVQRHLKAAGIFARLKHRDGKPRYMQDIPRTLAYITELVDEYDELEFLVDLITRRVLPGLEAQE